MTIRASSNLFMPERLSETHLPTGNSSTSTSSLLLSEPSVSEKILLAHCLSTLRENCRIKTNPKGWNDENASFNLSCLSCFELCSLFVQVMHLAPLFVSVYDICSKIIKIQLYLLRNVKNCGIKQHLETFVIRLLICPSKYSF